MGFFSFFCFLRVIFGFLCFFFGLVFIGFSIFFIFIIYFFQCISTFSIHIVHFSYTSRGGHSVETKNSVFTVRFILKFG